MREQLLAFSDLLKKMDDNPHNCMEFWSAPANGRTKFQMFIDCLIFSTDDQAIQGLMLAHLKARYVNSQKDYCYPSHMCHFHMSLKDWIDCPQTCLTEIQEFVEKIQRGD